MLFHATTTRDRTKTYRMSILHSERPRASQGTAVRSVAASPAVLPRDAEDFEVVVAMRW